MLDAGRVDGGDATTADLLTRVVARGTPGTTARHCRANGIASDPSRIRQPHGTAHLAQPDSLAARHQRQPPTSRPCSPGVPPRPLRQRGRPGNSATSRPETSAARLASSTPPAAYEVRPPSNRPASPSRPTGRQRRLRTGTTEAAGTTPTTINRHAEDLRPPGHRQPKRGSKPYGRADEANARSQRMYIYLPNVL